MRRRNFLLPVVALLGLILFFCLLTRLLLLRYERGDVYPAYSTLRSDPLGARAYYEALGSLPPYEVVRGFKSLRRELKQKPGTLFYLGLDSYELSAFSKTEVIDLDDYVKNGGRVVVTFAPQSPYSSDSDTKKKITEKKKADASKAEKKETSPSKPPAQGTATKPDDDIAKSKTEQEKYEREAFRKEKEEEAKTNPGHPNEEAGEKYQLSLGALWGFGYEVANATENNKVKDQPSAVDETRTTDKPEVFAEHLFEGNVEPNVPWKSALYFVRLEPEWQRIYSAKFNPVLIRRKWGSGEIILATDSYFISNEALRNNRRSELLGFLTGPPGRLMFDETHLGTEEQEGVMFLAEKFRLEGYLYGMLTVVLLFLWRNSIPLVPPRPLVDHTHLGGAVSGKDSRSGLVNLLRRNIAAEDILKTSFIEWRRAVTPSRRHLHEKMVEMESVLNTTDNRAETIVDAYHQLRKINTPSRAKGNYATKS